MLKELNKFGIGKNRVKYFQVLRDHDPGNKCMELDFAKGGLTIAHKQIFSKVAITRKGSIKDCNNYNRKLVRDNIHGQHMHGPTSVHTSSESNKASIRVSFVTLLP